MVHLRILLLALSACLTWQAPSGRHGDGWWLPKHSIERTLHWDDDSWVLSASSMAMQDRILLMPPVADRLAYLWNKKAVDSTDFEVIFTISGSLPSGTQQDGMLAFWLSLEDCASQYNEKAIVERALRDKGQDWKSGLKEQGYSVLTNKPTFKGLALVFLPFDAQRKLRQTIGAVYSDGSKALPEAMDKILEDNRASVVTSNWLPTGAQAAMSSTQASILEPNLGGMLLVKVRVLPDGSIVVSKRDLGVSHIPGSLWSWAPDGNEVKGTFVLQPDGTLSWKEHLNSGRWNLLPGGKLNITLFEANFILRLEGSRAVQEYPEFPTRAIAYLGKDSQEEEPWQQLLSLPSKTLPVPIPPTYLGITGYSGTKAGMQVNLNFFATVNRDPHVVGEAGFSIAQSKEWKEALAEEARFVDRASQREAVERVTKLLMDHVADEELLNQKIRSEIVTLDGRVESLSSEVGTYLAATQVGLLGVKGWMCAVVDL
eukprot:symbB.v1.2.034698.t1/scaffold4519.1/size87652/1